MGYLKVTPTSPYFSLRSITKELLSEEIHISLIKETLSKVLGHVTPISGTGKCIKVSIMTFFNGNNQYVNSIETGCKGTAANTD